MTVPAIETVGITATYGNHPALRNFSVRIAAGEFAGIIGPNGAGKTTLVRTCTGLLPVTSGMVLLNGDPITALPPVQRAHRVAFLPSDVSALFPYTVEEFIRMARFPYAGTFGRFSRADTEAVERALTLLEIADLRLRYIGDLSDGERQRVYLAQTLAQETPLLFLDEPTSHLDVGRQSSVMNLLADMNEGSGVTIVAILHDLNLAAEFCSRIFLLSDGQLIASGTPDQVLTPDIIRSVYGTPLPVLPSPCTGRPHVFPSRSRPTSDPVSTAGNCR